MAERLSISKREKIKAEPKIYHPTYTTCSYDKFTPHKYIESEISSNLMLQKFLYFNSFYSGMYFYMLLILYIHRTLIFDPKDIYNIVRIIFVFIIGILEFLRIYNGLSGNIKESFPELIAFLFLTVVSLVLNFVLIVLKNPMPLEFALLIVQIIFIGLEIIVGIYAMTKLVKSQTALFYLRSPQYEQKTKGFMNNKKEIEMKKENRRKNMKMMDDEIKYQQVVDESLQDIKY